MAAAVWSFGYTLELAADAIPVMTLWAKIEYIGIAATPVIWAIYAWHYTGQESWLTRRKILVLSAIPITTVLLVFTNEWHGLVWQTINAGELGNLVTFNPEYGWWFWIYISYAYLLLFVGSVILVRALWNMQEAYRSQIAVLLLAALSPWISNFLFIAGFASFDLTPLAFTISGGGFLLGMRRSNLFRIMPIARRVAVDNMADGLIVVDLESQIVDINPAAASLFDLPPEMIIGVSLQQFIQVRQFMEANPNVVIQSQENDTLNIEIAAPVDGQEHWYDLHISPLYDQRRQLRGRLIVLHDITQRKRVEQELTLARDQAMRTNKFKTEFVARVSHELRTPLNAILGYAEMLQEGMYGEISEKQKLPTGRIIKSAHFLTRQVNDLLDVSKLEAGKLNISLHPFSPAELLERVQGQISSLAQKKGLTLVMEVASDVPPLLSGDMSRLEQILLNLIGNALKFTKEGKVCTQIYRADSKHWGIKIQDTGQGIPEEVQEKIFEPFQQGYETASIGNLKSGTGLGLAIVKQLVGLMDGSIELQSTVEQGTTFTILFPLVISD